VHIDPLTLLIPNALAAMIAGIFLAGAWIAWGHPRGLLWWGFAHFAHGVSVALVSYAIATGDSAVFAVAVVLITAVPSFFWAGVRHFSGLRVLRWAMALPFAAFAAATAIPLSLGTSPQLATGVVSFLAWSAYMIPACVDLWRGRSERLPARRPLAAFLLLHSLIFVFGVADMLLGTFAAQSVVPLFSAFGLIYFESIIFTMGATFAMAMLVRERADLSFREETRFDVLTGASTRRSFFETAQRHVERAAISGEPISLIMFDLDRFKQINDTRGHAMGDVVLRGFAETARLLLRPSDVLGRFGGEEFIALLPATPVESAVGIAERIRRAFCESFRTLDGKPLKATVSAGVATLTPGGSFDEAMWEADRALYAAKEGGRNRVRRAGNPEGDRLVRIA